MPAPVALTVTPSSVVFSGFSNTAGNQPIGVEGIIGGGKYVCRITDAPAPIGAGGSLWIPPSADPSIEIAVTNGSVASPVAPILVDVFTDPIDQVKRHAILAELTTVQPGETVDELVECLPVTPMLLVLWHLAVAEPDVTNGFTVTVQAWKL